MRRVPAPQRLRLAGGSVRLRARGRGGAARWHGRRPATGVVPAPRARNVRRVIVHLTGPQWAAWFSPDAEERVAFREEMRASLARRLTEPRIAFLGSDESASVRDGDRELARVHRDGRLEVLDDRPRA